MFNVLPNWRIPHLFKHYLRMLRRGLEGHLFVAVLVNRHPLAALLKPLPAGDRHQLKLKRFHLQPSLLVSHAVAIPAH